MENFKLTAAGEINVPASPGSSNADFDFLKGKWTIHNRQLKSRLNNCTDWIEFEARQEMKKILLGHGNIDFFHTASDGKPFGGMTLRLFDPQTKLWSIYWADSERKTLDRPVKGSFENGVGSFYGTDIFGGKEILVKFKWDARHPATPVWSQAFSIDKGQTWEWNWYMYFSPV